MFLPAKAMKLPTRSLLVPILWRLSVLALCSGCGAGKQAPSALATLQGHTDRVNSVRFSPCGKFVASASSDTRVIVWEIASQTPNTILEGHEHRLTDAEYSGGGDYLVSVSAPVGVVKLWDVATWKEIEELKGTAVSLISEKKLIGLGDSRGKITLWNVAKKKVKTAFDGHNASISALAFANNGEWLASGSFTNGMVKVWDISREKEHVTLDKEQTMNWFSRTTSLAISSNGKVIGTGHYDGTIRLWKVETGEMVQLIKAHHSHVMGIAFNREATILVSGSSDRTVKLWHTSNGKLAGQFQGHTDDVSSVAFSINSQTVASGSFDGTVKLWDVSGIRLSAE